MLLGIVGPNGLLDALEATAAPGSLGPQSETTDEGRALWVIRSEERVAQGARG